MQPRTYHQQHAKWKEYEARQTEERKRLREYLAAVKVRRARLRYGSTVRVVYTVDARTRNLAIVPVTLTPTLTLHRNDSYALSLRGSFLSLIPMTSETSRVTEGGASQQEVRRVHGGQPRPRPRLSLQIRVRYRQGTGLEKSLV